MSTLQQKLKYVLNRTIARFKVLITDKINLRKSKTIDISNIKTVCLALGPYRNLTTLTALIISLHKNSRVLNHAGERIFGQEEIDFLLKNNLTAIDRFIQFALQISLKGQSGNLGGSIMYSHALRTNKEVKIDDTLSLENINCLFWKESHHTANLIRDRNINLKTILESDERIRFLLSIRNPMDCAVSNMNTGHVKIFSNLNKDAEIQDVLKSVLDEIFWFAKLKQNFPNRFFYFFGHSINEITITELARFLQLEADKEWLNNVLKHINIRPGYDHDKILIQYYNNYIGNIKNIFPNLYFGLKQYSNN